MKIGSLAGGQSVMEGTEKHDRQLWGTDALWWQKLLHGAACWMRRTLTDSGGKAFVPPGKNSRVMIQGRGRGRGTRLQILCVQRAGEPSLAEREAGLESGSPPWTVACQFPLSIEFSRQEYWNGLPFPSPGDLSDPGIEPTSPTLAGRFFTTEPPGKPTKSGNILPFSCCESPSSVTPLR